MKLFLLNIDSICELPKCTVNVKNIERRTIKTTKAKKARMKEIFSTFAAGCFFPEVFRYFYLFQSH